MKDTELLRLAARATGQVLDKEWNLLPLGILIVKEGGRELWKPLEDDGDAFRLAVKLGMSMSPGLVSCPEVYSDKIIVEAYPSFSREGIFAHEDVMPKLRRAIVLVAAKIGKTIST